MFKNLFKRGKAASEESTKPPFADMQCQTPWPRRWSMPAGAPSNRSRSNGRRNGKPHDPLPSPEVVEGNGGNTDWGLWTEAVRDEENAFAPTEPMPLRPR
jgi:hypothetical protein